MASEPGACPAPEDDREVPSLGIEEEVQLVDPDDFELRPLSEPVVAQARAATSDGRIDHEMRLAQVETISPVCLSLDEVEDQARQLRRALARAARRNGARIVMAGSHPFSTCHDQPFTPRERYRRMAREYGQLADEQMIFGLHVHVGIDDSDAAIDTMNRLRIWLPTLLALSASSPFWLGRDTGYASYRSRVWSRWPVSGPPPRFASHVEYDEMIRHLMACGVIDGASKVYWDMRRPEHLPTVEVRVCDACTRIDEVVMIAGLVLGLSGQPRRRGRTAADGEEIRTDVLGAASWHASRHGLEGELIDPRKPGLVPAAQLVGDLLEAARPGLEEVGEWERVAGIVDRTLREGNGADRQREVYRRTGSLAAVVEHLAEDTLRGVC